MTLPVSIVTAAPRDRETIANLLQLYLYEMTADLPFPIGRDGRFGYDYLDRFWQHPYLIFCGADLAGFALIIDESPVTGEAGRFFVAEFFVLKAYRGQGVGSAVFHAIVGRHPGRWQVGVIEKNAAAAAFWKKATLPYRPTSHARAFDGEDWLVRDFDADGASAADPDRATDAGGSLE